MAARASKQKGNEKNESRGSVEVPLGGLAIAAVVVALTCLVVLVIVGSQKGIEALPTIALSVAIVAFVVQLIVFIVQAAASSAQSLRSQELHGQLLELLAGIREQTQGTQAAFSTQNEKLLEAALGKVARERGLTEEGQRAVFEAAGQRGGGSTSGATPVAYPRRKPAADDDKHLEVLRSLPGDAEVRARLEQLNALTKMQKLFVRLFGNDERKTLEAGASAVYNPGLSSAQGLDEKGLVEEVQGPRLRWDDRSIGSPIAGVS